MMRDTLFPQNHCESPFDERKMILSCTDISQDLSQGMFVQQLMGSARMLPAHI